MLLESGAPPVPMIDDVLPAVAPPVVTATALEAALAVAPATDAPPPGSPPPVPSVECVPPVPAALKGSAQTPAAQMSGERHSSFEVQGAPASYMGVSWQA